MRSAMASPLGATSPTTSMTNGGSLVIGMSRATTANSLAPSGASFRELAERIGAAAPTGETRDRQPPSIERIAAAREPHIHAFGKPDPRGGALVRHRDQHR